MTQLMHGVSGVISLTNRCRQVGKGDVVDWSFIANGLGLEKTWYRDRRVFQVYYAVIPYWMVELPLILLTFILLLSSSRAAGKISQDFCRSI